MPMRFERKANTQMNSNALPTVAVIIPTKDRQDTILAAVLSAASQVPKPSEIIVVDDNSQDDTVGILKGRFGNEITLIKNDHSIGANLARQQGAEAAKSEVIAFLDSDDQFLPNKIQYQLKAMRAENVDYCLCGYITDDGAIYKLPKFNKRRLSKQNYLGGMTGLMIKRNLIIEEKLDPAMASVQDWELYIRLAKKSEPAIISSPLYLYTKAENNRISRNAKKRFQGHRRLWRLHIRNKSDRLILTYHRLIQKSLIGKQSTKFSRLSTRIALKVGAYLL